MYSVFGCPGTLLLIIIIIIIILYGRNEPLVRYCFLWLLCGRERFVQYCFLWRSCADAGCHVYVPWVYHFFFFFFFFFLSTLGRTNVFFVQEYILAKFGALRARSFNSRDRSLEGIDIVICMGVLACACERG